jgi:S-adenosylmethionine:tRNA ribosyltransferase-isomerase
MTAPAPTLRVEPVLDFAADPANEAHEPPEARGLRRDDVRLLVSAGDADPVGARFADLGAFLRAGDVLVVNTSATIPAALDGRLPSGEPVVVHLSGALPGGVSLVEVREPRAGSTAPRYVDAPSVVELLAGGHVRLLERFEHSRRLWIASLELGLPTVDFAALHGRPIRYRHVAHDWPIGAYQTVFAREPGSAEMPSASRPFSHEVVTDLVGRGVAITPPLLHTGVSSLEGNELPYPERYAVPRSTADAINAARDTGGRVVAGGTTVSRALATVTDDRGRVHPGAGWTDVVITPDRPVTSVDGLLTGWHEPESTHLLILESFTSRETLARAYRAALAEGYLWHEFGDSHLLLREDARR